MDIKRMEILPTQSKRVMASVFIEFKDGRQFRSNILGGPDGPRVANWGQLTAVEYEELAPLVLRAYIREKHPEVAAGFQFDLFGPPPAIPC
jgi:hypothetical protein